MGLLGDIIDGASSDGLSTTNLLRKVQTVAYRVGADDLLTWARSELDGYAVDAPLPTYRGPFPASVRAEWSGPYGMRATGMLSPAGASHLSYLFEQRFLQGVPELEELASKKVELGTPWDGRAIAEYNQLVMEEKVTRFQMMVVYSAHSVITPAFLRTIAESVRTKALDLALSLQAVNPAAGEVGGPTLADPAVGQTVTVNVNHIYGDGVNVAQGSGITQSTAVSKGDLTGLVRALQSLLADPEAISQVLTVVTAREDRPKKAKKLESLLTAVRGGSIALVSGVAANVGADRLLYLAHQFLGW